MTLSNASKKQTKKAAARGIVTPGQLLFGLFSLFCLSLILRNSDVAIEYMNQGLLLCAKTVIPSLFPFMVLSELIVSGGIGRALIQKISSPLGRLFRLSGAGCCALVLGLVCGFPIGARCTVLSYERGELSKGEAERVLACSGIPSSAFLISAVGVSLWGNRRFGVLLYVTVLICALLTAFLLAHLWKEKNAPPYPFAPLPSNAPDVPSAKLFTNAIRSATASILPICAYVVFFSALIGTFNLVFGRLPISPALRATLFGLFELSGGMSQVAALGNTATAACLCAFCAGWSGLSVHCQVLSLCDGRGFSFRPYFLSKLFQGLLCALLFGILIHFFPDALIPANFCVRG